MLSKILDSQLEGIVPKLLTGPELWNVVEALKSAKAELEEMEATEEWFVTETLERIEVALEILDE